MRRALALAVRSRTRTSPNPRVGAVLVRGRGPAAHAVAEGVTEPPGARHAEIVALDLIPRAAVRGATLYVTLEPCNHTGRTGPCTERVIAAGVARVVIALRDPNPIAGGGIERLRAAGIQVDVGLEAEAAAGHHGGFVSWATRRRPRVTLKAAVTLDGRMAAAGGDARWVTGEAARREAHRLRDRSDAILVGVGTVLADDPMLDTRLRGGHDPLRVILDGRLRTPPTAKVARAGTLFLATAAAPKSREAALRALGADVVRCPGAPGAPARVDLVAALAELGRRGVLELLVEGGAVVHGAFLAADLHDRVVVFVAPKLIGDGGVPLAQIAGPRRMADAWQLDAVQVRRLGDDVMISGERARR